MADPETKAQSFHWKMPGPPCPGLTQSKVKAMLTVSVDHEGGVHYEFPPSDQTVNKNYYITVPHQLGYAV